MTTIAELETLLGRLETAVPDAAEILRQFLGKLGRAKIPPDAPLPEQVQNFYDSKIEPDIRKLILARKKTGSGKPSQSEPDPEDVEGAERLRSAMGLESRRGGSGPVGKQETAPPPKVELPKGGTGTESPTTAAPEESKVGEARLRLGRLDQYLGSRIDTARKLPYAATTLLGGLEKIRQAVRKAASHENGDVVLSTLERLAEPIRKVDTTLKDQQQIQPVVARARKGFDRLEQAVSRLTTVPRSLAEAVDTARTELSGLESDIEKAKEGTAGELETRIETLVERCEAVTEIAALESEIGDRLGAAAGRSVPHANTETRELQERAVTAHRAQLAYRADPSLENIAKAHEQLKGVPKLLRDFDDAIRRAEIAESWRNALRQLGSPRGLDSADEIERRRRDALRLLEGAPQASAINSAAEECKTLRLLLSEGIRKAAAAKRQRVSELGPEGVKALPAKQQADLMVPLAGEVRRLRLLIADLDEKIRHGDTTELTQKKRAAEQSLKEALGALGTLYRNVPLDPEFKSADCRKRQTYMEGIRKSPAAGFADGKRDWDKAGAKEKVEAMQQVLEIQYAALFEGGPAPSMPAPRIVTRVLTEEERQRRGGQPQGFYSPRDNIIVFWVYEGSEDKGPLSSLKIAMDTAIHETTHAYQSELVRQLERGDLREGAPEYVQAVMFKANNEAYVDSGDLDHETYRHEPVEEHAWLAGATAQMILDPEGEKRLLIAQLAQATKYDPESTRAADEVAQRIGKMGSVTTPEAIVELGELKDLMLRVEKKRDADRKQQSSAYGVAREAAEKELAVLNTLTFYTDTFPQRNAEKVWEAYRGISKRWNADWPTEPYAALIEKMEKVEKAALVVATLGRDYHAARVALQGTLPLIDGKKDAGPLIKRYNELIKRAPDSREEVASFREDAERLLQDAKSL